MDPTLKQISLLIQTLILIFLYLAFFTNTSPSDYNILVYKQCDSLRNLKNKTDSTLVRSHSKTLSSFFHELESKSSRSKFFKTLVGNEKSAVSGSFQCRVDKSSDLCRRCVGNLYEISSTLCENAISARVQLQGCQLKYKIENIDIHGPSNNNHYKLFETPEHGLIHKICDGGTAETFAGFKEMRDAALAASAAGIVEGNGFYAANYELLHVVAQCDGDVSVCGCGECVATAAATAVEECQWSVSGQVYLDGCYVGYTYYPHGFPGNSDHEGGKIGNTGKTLAIVLGAAAALAFGAIFLRILVSHRKSSDDC